MSDEQPPADVEVFLAAERARAFPPAALEERVLVRLSASMAMLPVAAPSVGGGGLHAVKAAVSSKVGIAVLSFALGSGAGAGLHAASQAQAVPPFVVTPASSTVVSPPPVTENVTDEMSSPPAPEVRVAKPVPPAVPPAEGGNDTLASERALIEVARTALTRNQLNDAFDALERHQARHPSGQMSEEREALWIRCLRLDGRSEEAAKRAEAFRKRFPRSLLTPTLGDSE
jgi:hypothetical protein